MYTKIYTKRSSHGDLWGQFLDMGWLSCVDAVSRRAPRKFVGSPWCWFSWAHYDKDKVCNGKNSSCAYKHPPPFLKSDYVTSIKILTSAVLFGANPVTINGTTNIVKVIPKKAICKFFWFLGALIVSERIALKNGNIRNAVDLVANVLTGTGLSLSGLLGKTMEALCASKFIVVQ